MEQILSYINLGFIPLITILGLLLALRGIKYRKNTQAAIGASLVTLGILDILWKNPDTRDAISAFAALLVAIFAAIQLVENRKLRAESLKKSTHDEILKWATDLGFVLLEFGHPKNRDALAGLLNTTANSNGFLKMRIPHIQKLTELRMRSVYAMEIGKTLPDVSPKLETVVESLRKHLRMLYKYDEYRGKLPANTGLTKAALNLGNSEFSLYSMLVELIKDLGNINSII